MKRRTVTSVLMSLGVGAGILLLAASQAPAQCWNGYYGSYYPSYGYYGTYYPSYYYPGAYSYTNSPGAAYYFPSNGYAYSGGTYQSYSYVPSSVGSTRGNPSGMVTVPNPVVPNPTYYYYPSTPFYSYSSMTPSRGGTAGHPSPGYPY